GWGIGGRVSVGLFAVGSCGLPGPEGADTAGGTVTGLLYGGGTDQLFAQIKGSLMITACVLAAGLIVMYLVKLTRTLRISEAGEIEGLDIHEHGAPAYHPEPAYEGYSPIPAAKRSGNGGALVGQPVRTPTTAGGGQQSGGTFESRPAIQPAGLNVFASSRSLPLPTRSVR